MRIITISRQFGSGGRELGKRLAELLGYAYYDREIITAIAQNKGLDAGYVDRVLQSNVHKSIPMTFRHSFHTPMVMNMPQTELLLEQQRVIEGIAQKGENCVIVGRNADVLLEKYAPLCLFVCADKKTKIQRCLNSKTRQEHLTEKRIEQNMKQIDKNRASFRELVCDAKWGDPATYDLTINTTYFEIKDIAASLAEYIKRLTGDTHENTTV